MERYLVKAKPLAKSTEHAVPEPTASFTGAVHQNENNNIGVIEDETGQDELATISEPSIKRRKYIQKFKDAWTKKFDWLQCTDDKECGICKICNVKIKGSVTHLERHDKSKTHVLKYKAALTTPSAANILHKKQDVLSTSKLVNEAELKIVMFLAEHNLPFSLCEHLTELIPSICPDSKVAKKINLKRKRATQITVSILGPVNKKSVLSDIRNIPFSFIIDETTDISTSKCLAVLVRYFKNNKVHDRFLDLIEVEAGSAECLFNSIKRLMDENAVPYQNIIGFGADNCAVMMGNLNGVKARFQTINPNIVAIGCTCHSFHLCSSYACKKLPENLEQFTRDIYNYFSNSSKRLTELKECEVFLNEKPHVLLKPSQTRWLSLQSVVNRILEHWAALELIFTRAALEDNFRVARQILNALKNPIYKLYFHFLSYILEIVNRLNLEFQSESPKIHLLLSRVNSLYKLILKSFLKPCYVESVHLNDVVVSNPHNYIPLDEIYCGAKVQNMLSEQVIELQDVHNFKIRVLDFYIELAKQIKKRFNFEDKILKFCSKFNPRTVLSGNVISIAEVSNTFSLNIDIEMLDLEYRLMSETEDLKKYKDKDCDIVEFYSQVGSLKNPLGKNIFENIMKVVRVIMCLPHSSAAAERIFSQLNLMKTKTRNRLLVKTCESLIHTKEILRSENKKCFDWIPSRDITSFNKHFIDVQEVVVEDVEYM